MNINDILKIQNPSNANIMCAIGKVLEVNNDSYKKITENFAETKQLLIDSIKEIKTNIKTIDARIDHIEDDLGNTNSCVKALQSEVNFLKQQQFNKDILISGLPITVTDNDDILTRLDKVYNFGLGNVESKFSRSITTGRSGRSGKGTHLQLIVTFKNIVAKNFIMGKIRENGPIFLRQLYSNLGTPKDTIIIRERLTKTNNDIMKELLQLKKNKKILFCWFRHSNIYIKKAADDKPQIIRDINDILSLKKKLL